MGDSSERIPEPPPPIHVDDGEFTPTYDPSPDLVELVPVISEIGTIHDRPTHSRVDSPLTHYRYVLSTWMEPLRPSADIPHVCTQKDIYGLRVAQNTIDGIIKNYIHHTSTS